MLKSLFRRSGVYFFGLTLSKILSTIVFILAARTLPPSAFGDLVLFVMLIQILTVLADFGLNQWYQKTAEGVNKNFLFGQVLSARLLTLVLTTIGASIFVAAVPSFSHLVSMLFVIALIPEAFLSIADGYYLEQKKPLRVSFKITIRMLLFLIGYFIFIRNFSVELAVQFYIVATVITIIWYFPWNKLKYITATFLSKALETLKLSSPYAFLTLTSFAYARGDSIVVRYTLSSFALGLYGGAYRYLESLSLLPTALSHNLFPISAKKKGITTSQLIKIMTVTIIAGSITSIIVFLTSNWLIVILIGKKYIEAVPILRIFSLVLFLFFINAPLATIVQSSHLVKKFLPYGVINTIGNIILNIIFVPIYGVAAAAWVMLTTEVTGFIINAYFAKKIYS